ncbi:MAG: response regulator transcription factor [Betaproteobacteria bacterium]
MRALVVEDDALLAAGLESILRRAGHSTNRVSTGVAADRALRSTEFDLVVLDIGLPDISGFEVLRRLRGREINTHVLVLTARDGVDDRVRGLDLGADDYLTKPFSVTEFEARVRAVLRRSASVSASSSYGALQLDRAAKRATVRGVPIELTPREWNLLELFVARPGRVVSKDQISSGLHLDEQLSPNAVEVYVSRLRSKLGPAGSKLRTVRGFGYIWETDDR